MAKLMYVRDESVAWVIKPSFGSEGKFPFIYEDSKRGTNRTGAANMIGVGELFFPAGVMQDRFKLLGSEARKITNPRTKAESEVTIVRIEDQRPNKKGMIYEFPSPFKEEQKADYVKYDRTAVLSLQAVGLSGKEFKVEENTTFSLPPDGPKKNYRLKEVTPASITIEDVDGKGKPIVITKGNMPTNEE
jgi:hypothetical protein